MSDESAPSPTKYQRQNQLLQEQVRLLVRTEQRLNKSQAELDNQLERIRALSDFALTAARTTSMNEIAKLAGSTLLRVFPGDVCLTYRVSVHGQTVELRLTDRVGRRSEATTSSKQLPIARAALPVAPLVAADGDETPSAAHNELLEALRAEAGVAAGLSGLTTILPLRALSSEPIALIVHRKDDRSLVSHQRLPAEVDQPFLELLTAHTEAAIGNAGRRESLEHAVDAHTRDLEEANRELEVLHVAIERAVDAVEVLDAQSRYQYVNVAYEKLTGYSRDDAIGKNAWKLLHGEDATPKEIHHALAAGKPWRGEVTTRTKGGDMLQLEITVAPVLGDNRELTNVVVVRRDVRDRVRLENQLRVTERMASLGRLAAGVGHEINNPLSYILLNLRYIHEVLAAWSLPEAGLEQVMSALNETERGAERVSNIVRDLMTFSRAKDEEHVGPVDSGAAIAAAARVAGNEIRHKAQLILDLGDVPPVRASTSRFGQIILNLLVNAAQAIEAGRVEHNEIRVTTRLSTDGGSVAIVVRDSGRGMSAETIHHVFEPFFTTKEVGVGTGLGLSICHGIVTRMGGTIRVESTPGIGTAFTVELPTCGDDPSQVSSVPAPPSIQPARILVIDDDIQVGQALKRLFRHHAVTFAASATEGLERGCTESYDVVLCDLMMPDMAGPELYRRLKEKRPDVAERMAFITGGAFTPEAQAFIDQVSNRCFRKPFDVRELEWFVNEQVTGDP